MGLSAFHVLNYAVVERVPHPQNRLMHDFLNNSHELASDISGFKAPERRLRLD